MHIAFLTPEFPGPVTGHSGGLGTSIKNLAEALTPLGIKVFIFVYGQTKDEEYEASGIAFYRIRNVRVRGISWWLTRKKIERIINQAVKNNHIDFLEVADWTGISAWMSIDCPVVMRLHGSDTYFCHLDKRTVKWWNKLQERTAFKQADAIIAVSDFVGKKTNQVFGLNRDYKVINNGLDSGKFNLVTNEFSSPIILYFGTLIRKKGVLDIPLIFNKVIESVPEAKLVLVGGDAADIFTGSVSTWKLMELLFSEKSKPNVSYLGKKPYEDIRQYIEKAAVCIFPSYAEALPVSWLEAMAMGKAIVASDIGWATEMLTHEHDALLCNPSKHEAFASSVIQLLRNDSLRYKLGIHARKRLEQQFNNTLVVEQNISFYRKVIES